MTDQARLLREAAFRPLVAAAPPPLPAERDVLVVGSGKGGSGKSLVSLTLAAAFASRGRQVLLVDGDQNLGNLHLLLGVRPPIRPELMIDGQIPPADVVVPVADNLWLMPAACGDEGLQCLSGADRARLHRRIATLFPDYDLVVVDAAAGLDSALRCASLRATRLVVVTTPEPTALSTGYALIKMVHGRLPRLPLDVVVNRTVDTQEGPRAAARLVEASHRFLGRDLRILGEIPDDPGLRARLATPAALIDVQVAGPAQARIHAIAHQWFPHTPATSTPAEELRPR